MLVQRHETLGSLMLKTQMFWIGCLSPAFSTLTVLPFSAMDEVVFLSPGRIICQFLVLPIQTHFFGEPIIIPVLLAELNFLLHSLLNSIIYSLECSKMLLKCKPEPLKATWRPPAKLFLVITWYQKISLSLILCLFYMDIQVTKRSMIIARLDLETLYSLEQWQTINLYHLHKLKMEAFHQWYS